MKIKFEKPVFLVVIVIVVLAALYVGIQIIEEKYCYNLAFIKLENRGIKLGKVPSEYTGANYFSPLTVAGTPGQREWSEAYLDCRNNFTISAVSLSVLRKSYPNYYHFIDW